MKPKMGETTSTSTSTSASTEAARHLASLRRQVSGTCEVCGQPFVGTKKRRYCSPRCTWRAWYERQKADQQHQTEEDQR